MAVGETPDPAKGAEIMIEGAIFEHQHDDVLDVLNRARDLRRGQRQGTTDARRESAKSRGKGSGVRGEFEEAAAGVVRHG